jgi:hypothetical protein
MEEWEVFILEAQEEWSDFKTRHPLQLVEEQSCREEIEDKSMGLTKGELFSKFYLSPKDFTWKEPTNEPCPLNICSKALEGAKSNRRAEDDIADLQAAVEDLAILNGAVAKALWKNAVEVLDYLWLSVCEAIKAIDCLNHQVQVWKEVVGNFAVLQDNRGAIVICSKLSSVLGDIDALKLDDRFDEMLQRFDVWEGDDIRNHTHLNNKAKGLIKVQAAPPPIVTQRQLSLCLSTPITDDKGIHVGVFGDIMGKLDNLKTDNTKLSDWLESIKADVTAQGGVVLGHHTFTSELQIMQVAMLECP